VIFAEDDAAYETLSQKDLPRATLVRTSYEEETLTLGGNSTEDRNRTGLVYGTEVYKKLVTTRPTRLLSVFCSIPLEDEANYANQRIVYADVDSVWKKDPLPLVNEYLQYGKNVVESTTQSEDNGLDIVAQVDNPSLDPVAYCTGFLAMRQNINVLHLLTEWETDLQKKWEAQEVENAGDQPVFNSVIHNSPYLTGLIHAGLPSDVFPPGNVYFDNENTSKEDRERAVVVHNNWIVGHHNKKVRFYIWELWLLEGGDEWWASEEAGITRDERIMKTLVRSKGLLPEFVTNTLEFLSG